MSRARQPWPWQAGFGRRRLVGIGLAATAGLAAAAVWSDAARSPSTIACPRSPSDGPEIVPGARLETTSRRMAVRIQVDSPAELEVIVDGALDVWSERTDGTTIDVVVWGPSEPTAPPRMSPGRIVGPLQLGDEQRIVEYEILDWDIDATAAVESARLAEASIARPAPGEWFAEYRDFDTVIDYLEVLAASHPELARIEDVGASIEGRPLRAIHLGTDADAPTVTFNGGQHAREWISVATTTCLADRLARGYAADERIQRLLDTTRIVILPVANPDGYVYSWTDDRYWRKNRRGEYGVDLNRNYAVAFGERGASKDPRSPIYHGAHAFSEPESAAIRDLIRRERPLAHIDFHSYSQLVLYPWSFTRKKSPDHDVLTALARRYAEVVEATHGKKYTPKTGGALYPASGTLMDWAYAERDIPSFVVELRPKARGGFVLPPDEIVPTCEENLAAVLDLVERLPR